MLRSRLSARWRLGFASTAMRTVSPSTANTTGTRWGCPSPATVARRATRAAANRRRASSTSSVGMSAHELRELVQLLEDGVAVGRAHAVDGPVEADAAVAVERLGRGLGAEQRHRDAAAAGVGGALLERVRTLLELA